jgi:hypothetical protein
MKKFFLSIFYIAITSSLCSQEAGKPLPIWQKGEMEIHHIFTGKGECVFCIFPDGTTMLIDAGDLGPNPMTKISPDDSRQPGEWISMYIQNRTAFQPEKHIDYMFLTHFHGDHMGSVFENSPRTKKGGDFFLSGITEVGEYIQFDKMVDRAWPEYNYPAPLSEKSISNYRNFVKWNVKKNGMKMEQFITGSNEQFRLLYDNERFKNLFEVRNIVANGEVWTGVGNETRHYFPEEIPSRDLPDENKCSAGIRISYGAFDYFNGGDLTGRLSLYAPGWKDIETPVGKSVGPVEVCEVNHHAYIDAMNESFISSVRPQVFVIQVWDIYHTSYDVLKSLLSQGLYLGKRDIFPTHIPEETKAYMGETNLKTLAGRGGHVVIKVAPGGKQYNVILLSTEDDYYRVNSIHGPYICR